MVASEAEELEAPVIDPSQALPPVCQPPPPTLEHPEGDAIRRQVEYYFSDQNLPTDRHLLEKCGGRENIPVSIKSIMGFRKMRQYKPFTQVVEALKKSSFLDVVDNKRVKRKIPLTGRTVLDEGPESDSDLEGAPKPAENPKKSTLQIKQPQLPLQQKKEKPYGWDKPHGFEEFFADAPVTPAEYKEEVSMYDPGVAFRVRMEIAIQRFKARRTMHQHLSNVFSKFMKFGGVEFGQRQFTGGIDDPMLENRDAADIALMMSTHTIDEDKDDESRWSVDFEAVAKGFLSSYWPCIVSYDVDSIHLATRVLRNFYNYLLHHNVCPEYEQNIYAARNVCNLTDEECPKVIETALNLPGDFNIACSTLFGGYYSDKYIKIGDWDNTDNCGDDTLARNHSLEEAHVIFKTGIAAYGTDAQFNATENEFSKITSGGSTEGVGMEITSIESPSAEALALYAAQNCNASQKIVLKPLGKLHGKHWDIPDFVVPDLPASHIEHIKRDNAKKTYEFWVEADVLEHCFVGMKMQACVRTLSLGLQVLDQVHEVYFSFYSYMPNELMLKWKEPKFHNKRAKGDSETAEDGRKGGDLD